MVFLDKISKLIAVCIGCSGTFNPYGGLKVITLRNVHTESAPSPTIVSLFSSEIHSRVLKDKRHLYASGTLFFKSSYHDGRMRNCWSSCLRL